MDADNFPRQSPYRTDAFFDDSELFASKEDFFEQARRKLLQDCGYEARPSKQKPTRISARCEKYATEGCPFRLSARLDEGAVIWRLSAANCTWQHSHVPIAEVRVGDLTPAAAKRARDDDGPSISTDWFKAANGTERLYGLIWRTAT